MILMLGPTLSRQMELAKVFAVNVTLVDESLLVRFCSDLKPEHSGVLR